MNDRRLVIVKVGYVEFAIPAEALQFVPAFRPVDSNYDNGYHYHYYFDDEQEVSMKFLDAETMLPCKPEKVAPVAVPSVPTRPLEAEVIPAAPEDGSEGIQAARDLVAGESDYATISFIRSKS